MPQRRKFKKNRYKVEIMIEDTPMLVGEYKTLRDAITPLQEQHDYCISYNTIRDIKENRIKRKHKNILITRL